ncbi:hypothetical protein, partial [Plasmodium yoelii yoelii]
YFQI